MDRDHRFLNTMEKLAGDIASLLELMRKKVDGKIQVGSTLPVAGKSSTVIYLAETTDDLIDDRRLLQQDLERAGARVVPGDFLSNRRDEAEQEIRRALAEAQFAVHLFSDQYGKPLRGDNQCSLPHLQLMLSRERAVEAKGKFDRYVWIADVLDRSKIRSPQRELLEGVENESEKDAPVDLQDGTLTRLKESLLKRVAKPVRPISKSRRGLIYVTGKTGDMATPDAAEVIKYLNESHDVFRGAVPGEDDEKKRKQHETYCQRSDGLVLFFGDSEPEWVQVQALDIRDLAERRRRERRLAAAVYEAPPEDRADLPFQFEDVLLVDGRKGFDPQKLTPFLERMEAGGEI
jgi:hypothetical protein